MVTDWCSVCPRRSACSSHGRFLSFKLIGEGYLSLTPKVHALGLGLGKHRVIGKDQVMGSVISLTYLDHPLQDLSVWCKKNKVIHITKCTIPQIPFVAAQLKLS